MSKVEDATKHWPLFLSTNAFRRLPSAPNSEASLTSPLTIKQKANRAKDTAIARHSVGLKSELKRQEHKNAT